MSLWRLEWLRLTRTRRWLALGGVFLFFGLLGPLTARYMDVLIGRLAAGIEVRLPPPTPADGIIQYTSNASQLGLLVVIILAVSALAVDARPEQAVFYRTRVPHARHLLLPRFVVSSAASCAAFVLGAAAAWYQSVVLLGDLPVGGMLAGIAYGCLYVTFAVAVVAAATATLRGLIAPIAVTAAALLALPALGLIEAVRGWLPHALLSSLPALAAGAAPADYLRAAATAAALTLALLGLAAFRLQRRET
jgi:ABC-2 type transport system permease protein